MLLFENALYAMRRGYGAYRSSRRKMLNARYYIMKNEKFYSVSFENPEDVKPVEGFPMTMILADDYKLLSLGKKVSPLMKRNIINAPSYI